MCIDMFSPFKMVGFVREERTVHQCYTEIFIAFKILWFILFKVMDIIGMLHFLLILDYNTVKRILVQADYY